MEYSKISLVLSFKQYDQISSFCTESCLQVLVFEGRKAKNLWHECPSNQKQNSTMESMSAKYNTSILTET